MLSAYPVNTGIAFHRMEGRFISSNFFYPSAFEGVFRLHAKYLVCVFVLRLIIGIRCSREFILRAVHQMKSRNRCKLPGLKWLNPLAYLRLCDYYFLVINRVKSFRHTSTSRMCHLVVIYKQHVSSQFFLLLTSFESSCH